MLDTLTETERLGLATELLCATGQQSRYGLGYIRFRIQPAIKHDQIYFAFDDDGNVLAYWIWAFLCSDVEDRLTHDPRAILHDSEWNEGDNLWIFDLIAPYGHARDVIRFIRGKFFLRWQCIKFMRSRNDGNVLFREWHRPIIDVRRSGTGTHARRFSLSDTDFSASRTDWLQRSPVDPDTAPQRWLRKRRRDVRLAEEATLVARQSA